MFSFTTAARRSREKTKHVDVDKLMSLRATRESELGMERRLGRVFQYSVYVLVIWLISYGQRHSSHHYISKHIVDTLVARNFTKVRHRPT